MSDRQVWVGCLACYNEGNLNGEWLAPEDGEDWACKRGTDLYPHEETWVFDHEGFGAEGEGSPAHFAELDKLWSDAEEVGPLAAWELYVDNVGSKYATVEGFRDAYLGEYGSLKEYAEETFSDCYEIPEHLAPYIDYEAIARDMGFEGYWEADGYVFSE